MPENNNPATLGSIFYPDTSSGVDRARAFSEAGVAKVGGEPAPSTGPSEPSDLAKALYGAGVDPSIARTKQLAGHEPPAPPQQYRGTSVDQLPLSADPAAHDLHTRADAPASDAEPQPSAAEIAALNSLREISDELGIDDEAQERLKNLHTAQIQKLYTDHEKTVSQWRQQAEREIPQQQLESIRNQFDRALQNTNSRDAAEIRRLLSWSGVGNSAAFIRFMASVLNRR